MEQRPQLPEIARTDVRPGVARLFVAACLLSLLAVPLFQHVLPSGDDWGLRAGPFADFTANLRAIWPLGRFEPYATVGIGVGWANLVTRQVTGIACSPGFVGWWCTGTRTRLADGVSFVTKLGGGVDFWMSEDFGLTVDAVYLINAGGLEELDYLKLGWGAKFRF